MDPDPQIQDNVCRSSGSCPFGMDPDPKNSEEYEPLGYCSFGVNPDPHTPENVNYRDPIPDPEKVIRIRIRLTANK